MASSACPPVLIAHGDAVARSALVDLLSVAGYSVTSCDNGLDALRKLRAQRFALVLTAISMPKADGLELLRTAMESRLDMPVIVLATADPIEQIYLRSAEALGAVATHTAPYSAADLLESVEEALAGRPQIESG